MICPTCNRSAASYATNGSPSTTQTAGAMKAVRKPETAEPSTARSISGSQGEGASQQKAPLEGSSVPIDVVARWVGEDHAPPRNRLYGITRERPQLFERLVESAPLLGHLDLQFRVLVVPSLHRAA